MREHLRSGCYSVSVEDTGSLILSSLSCTVDFYLVPSVTSKVEPENLTSETPLRYETPTSSSKHLSGYISL